MPLPLILVRSGRRPAVDGRCGFALVIALVCMGFIVLLLLSLSSLSQVNLSVQRQQQALGLARANALLGLQVAIGQLQVAMGPDQRISAPAAIRPGAKDGRSHWTGAWEANPDGGKAGDFLGWLVSLPDGKDNVEALADAATVWESVGVEEVRPTDSEWVTLVGPGSVEGSAAAPGNFVVAGKASVEGGSYAWWVGDEGVKARINLAEALLEDTAAADSADTLRRLQLSPAQMGVQKAVPATLGTIDRSNPQLPQISQLEQLALVGANQQIGRESFHDFTLHSRAVLTNTRSGGLKYDLSHLLESDAAFDRHFGSRWSDSYTFKPADATISFQHGAPNWGILRDYYKLPDRVANNTIQPFPPQDGTKKAPVVSAYQTSANLYHWNNPVHPILSWMQVGIGIEYRKEEPGDGSIRYRPRLHIRPLVALYNPYDIKLSAYTYELGWLFAPKFTIQVEGQAPVVFRLSELMPVRRLPLRIADTDFLPGETRYYGLDSLQDLSDSQNVGSALMQSSWTDSGSYYVDLSPLKSEGGKVYEPANEGPTSAETDSLSENKRWGLTPAEKERLSFTAADSTTPLPALDIEISYDPAADTGISGEDTGTAGLFVLKVPVDLGSSVTALDATATHGTDYFQDTIAAHRPADVLKSYSQITDANATANLFWFGIGLKTPSTVAEPERLLIDTNPRFISASTQVDGYREGNGLSTISGWTGSWMDPGQTLPEPQVYDPSPGSRYGGYFGYSRTADGGAQSAVLFHVPRERPLSLGLFQHAVLSRFSRDPAYIVGNSYAPPRIETSATVKEPFLEAEGRKQNAYDWAQVVNLGLWDAYYFSGLDQAMTEEDLQAYLDGKVSLRNPRLRLVANAQSLPTLERLTETTEANTATNAISHLELDGPFNINSTSVGAWKALLASNAGLKIPIYDADGTIASTNEETEAVFYRTPIAYSDAEQTADNSVRFWSGYRRLNDSELTALATAIVSEVKARGPFGSLADFVNRRPGSSDAAHRRRGALQAALDTAINKALPATSHPQAGATGTNLGLRDYNTAYNNDEDRTGTGATGWILQGDLLQIIGPLLTPRSDTFRIRTYGEVAEPGSGGVAARIWCEAIVQRTVDKVDAGEAIAAADPPNGSGRRFRVLAFRWLDKP